MLVKVPCLRLFVLGSEGGQYEYSCLCFSLFFFPVCCHMVCSTQVRPYKFGSIFDDDYY